MAATVDGQDGRDQALEGQLLGDDLRLELLYQAAISPEQEELTKPFPASFRLAEQRDGGDSMHTSACKDFKTLQRHLKNDKGSNRTPELQNFVAQDRAALKIWQAEPESVSRALPVHMLLILTFC